MEEVKLKTIDLGIDFYKTKLKQVKESISDLENGGSIKTISISRRKNKRKEREPSEKQKLYFLEFLKLEEKSLEKIIKEKESK